jgi:hypothetical protein
LNKVKYQTTSPKGTRKTKLLAADAVEPIIKKLPNEKNVLGAVKTLAYIKISYLTYMYINA